MTVMKPYRCPSCGVMHDRVATVGPEATLPSAGDLSFCIKCGEWSIFLPDLSLRAPTDDEHIEIGHDPDCIRLRKAWGLVPQPGIDP